MALKEGVRIKTWDRSKLKLLLCGCGVGGVLAGRSAYGPANVWKVESLVENVGLSFSGFQKIMRAFSNRASVVHLHVQHTPRRLARIHLPGTAVVG